MKHATRRLWRCPKCGHHFATRNMWHSCRPSTSIAAHFQGKPAGLRMVFNRFRALLRACGPVIDYARSNGIVFQVRVRFAGIRVRRKWVEASLWLERRVRHSCLVRTTPFRAIGSHGYGHYFHFATARQLDAAFARLVREAYAVGAQTSRRRK